MHHIIYIRRAAYTVNNNDLEAILRQARRNNERRNITGALAYGAGQFMQIMEGEKADLDAVYALVSHAPRHTGLTKLADKEISQRSFSDWSMAFQTLSPKQFDELVGYTAPDELNDQAHNLSAADDLLFQMMSTFGLTQRA
jgi:hypothetical protein